MSEPEKILDLENFRIEPGMTYPLSVLDQYTPAVSALDRIWHRQIVDSFMHRPTRDELFIKGRLD